MIGSERTNRILWAAAGALAVVASMTGLLLPGIYDGVVHAAQRPGMLSQDLVTVVVAVALVAISSRSRGHRPKSQIAAIGLVAYLAYAYGILAIERAYNPLYLVYLAVFALSTWAVAIGCASLRTEVTDAAVLPRWARRLSAAGALLQPVAFIPLWVSALLPLMASRHQIDALYSIYVLDLGFVMPAFAVVAVLTLRNRGTGLVLAPAMFVFGTALIASLAVGELVAPVFGRPPAVGALLVASALTLLFAALAAVHLGLLVLPGTKHTAHGGRADERTAVAASR